MRLHYINWNKATRKYEENYSFQAKKCTFAFSIICFSFMIYSLFNLYAKNSWDQEKILFMVAIWMLILSAIFIAGYPYVNQKKIITILDCINGIDLLMGKYTQQNVKKRPKNKYVLYLPCAYTLSLIEMLGALITYLLRSDLRELTLQGIVIPIALYYALCVLCYKIIISDRIEMLSDILQSDYYNHRYQNLCYVCKGKRLSKYNSGLCPKHLFL